MKKLLLPLLTLCTLASAINAVENEMFSLEAEIKTFVQDPEVQKLLALGHAKRFSVVHIIYTGTVYAHSFKDYNFVRSAVNLRLKMGYKNAIAVLNKPEWEKKSNKTLSCSIYGVPPDYFDQH